MLRRVSKACSGGRATPERRRRSRAQLSPDGQTLVVTFTINRGARHYVERVEIPPTLAVPPALLRELIGRVARGRVFDQTGFEAGVAAAINEYRRRGYYQADAEPSVEPVA